jgi:hypothetical protein
MRRGFREFDVWCVDVGEGLLLLGAEAVKHLVLV